MWLTPPGSYRATTCRERELTLDHIHIFDHTITWGMRSQLNAGDTSETTRTWKTIHTIHAPIHTNKANMKGWLWRPNDILDLVGLKLPDICLRGKEKPRKTHPGNLSRPRIEPGPAAWQALLLPPALQRWTKRNISNLFLTFIKLTWFWSMSISCMPRKWLPLVLSYSMKQVTSAQRLVENDWTRDDHC